MDYIVDFYPYKEHSARNDYYADIEKRISKGESITQNEAENFLRRLSYEVRQSINPNMDNYDYKCDLARSIFGYYFDKIGCKYSPCATHMAITNGVDGHSFTVVSLNVEGEEKPYLLDPTYIQFFHKEKCQESAYFVSPILPNSALLTPDAGYFIKDEDMDAANFLLRYGYIELTPEYARMYGDSFYNTDRGLKLNPKEKKSLPGLMYLKSFKDGHEPLSTTHEKLLINNQNVVNFNSLESVSKKAI